jgi:hypothetical protein
MTQQPHFEYNKLVVREFNFHVIQGAHWGRFAEFVGSEFINHTAPTADARGADGFKAFFMTVLHGLVSDFRHDS